MDEAEFTGFTKGTLSFFKNLEKNNTREWFEAHREQYDEDVVAPSRAFVVTMGAKLKKIAPGVIADPRVNRSLFRLNRDTRFSKDKSPYKTHFGIMMWEGAGPRMECSCFYFHYENSQVFIGAGIYAFCDNRLDQYRQACVDPVLGGELAKAVKTVTKSGVYSVGGTTTTRVPRGFDADHPNAELLKHKGLYAGITSKIPEEFYTPAFVDWCFTHYRAVAPLHRALVSVTASGV